MKKIIALILALILCFALCSCGKSKASAEPADCIRIDTIDTGKKTYELSYVYNDDGLITQCTFAYSDTEEDGTVYNYEDEYNFEYDSKGDLIKVTEISRSLDEDSATEFDWTRRYASDCALIDFVYDAFTMTLDENGFMVSGKDALESGDRANEYTNTYDMENGQGTVTTSSGSSWTYTFSIVQAPAENQQKVMNLINSFLVTFW